MKLWSAFCLVVVLIMCLCHGLEGRKMAMIMPASSSSSSLLLHQNGDVLHILRRALAQSVPSPGVGH